MASYRLFFKRSAEKELRRISPPYVKRIVERIRTLSHDPRPSGVQMLKGENRHFRLRQGDYRIVYEVDDPTQEITVIKAGQRREVYD